MNVGVRELRDGLSRHLAQVRAGHSVTVTDHGVPIARILPVGAPSALEQRQRSGRRAASLIAYLDTSTLVPLLIDEPASPICARLWDDADDVVSVRIAYVQAAAAITQARRLGRLTRSERRHAVSFLEETWSQMQIVEVDHVLMQRAGALADAQSLRGYDATHCAVRSRSTMPTSWRRAAIDCCWRLGDSSAWIPSTSTQRCQIADTSSGRGLRWLGRFTP